ncbi:L-threonylcarbamoyladenylate synthase [Patescibacteria group bacterium]|nr:L-threonylcarbamoyladenylate synthase [Patescibacteria group bacterium]MBU1964142.1 L-threonylcarbamoyladenylate synthase [Patescibacteria group bacterium]
MPNQIEKAAHIIKEGGLVIFPTDTAYALGGLFDSKEVEDKILKIKKRTKRRFTLVACCQEQVEKYFDLDDCQKNIAKKFWPGPVSIVLNRKYAIRVPDAEIPRKLAELVGKPLIATSANISTEPTRYDLKDLELKGYDYAIDIGPLPRKSESAILQCFQNDIKILRPGPKETNEQIRAFISS